MLMNAVLHQAEVQIPRVGHQVNHAKHFAVPHHGLEQKEIAAPE